MNLNELHVPDDADTALDWAVRREYGLRYDSYRECTLRGLVAPVTPRKVFACQNPEEAWIHSVRAELLEEQR